MRKLKFDIGDLVQLLSRGSPQMTVIGHTKDGQVDCAWFDKGKDRRSTYPAAALKPAHNEPLDEKVTFITVQKDKIKD
jgi:uncharacterized protein YodC (DUF2158 family)